MINEIYLNDEVSKLYSVEGSVGSLSNLNRINIFIGPNNSGKSRLLRQLFYGDFAYQITEINFKELSTIANEMFLELSNVLKENSMSDVSSNSIPTLSQLISKLKERLEKGGLPNEFESIKETISLVQKLTTFEPSGGSHLPGSAYPFNGRGMSKQFQTVGNKYKDKIPSNLNNVEIPKFEKLYIPVLRGLRPLQSVSSTGFQFQENYDSYKKRTIRDYFYDKIKDAPNKETEEEKLRIITGQSMYSEVRKMLLGSLQEREKIRKFELFLSRTLFESRTVSLTPHIEDDCLHITIGNEDRPIYNLGDGIQNLIILLYPIFLSSNQKLICFVEEPEMSLHPGFQRLFIETLLNEKFGEIQYFMTTHSNHFLDMTLDHSQISIYEFKKKISNDQIQFTISNSQNEHINLLNSIGVRNSSIFLSNCTIWVEGITDRLYLNKYLEVYQRNIENEKYETKHFKEDLHYSFIEYGGVNIVHYSFGEENSWDRIKASKISGRIMVVADEDGTSDKPGSAKAERLGNLKKTLGNNLLVLPCREIENSIAPTTIKAVITEIEGHNNLTFNDFFEANYKKEFLGSFIETHVNGIEKKYAEKNGSGTLNNKISFCKRAIDKIRTMDDLSDSAKEIVGKLYNYIKLHNS